jgi:hypothetical protein
MLDLFVKFVALVAHGEPVLTANRGNPHWLPDGKYGWNGNLFAGLYRFRRGTGRSTREARRSKWNASHRGALKCRSCGTRWDRFYRPSPSLNYEIASLATAARASSMLSNGMPTKLACPGFHP